MAGLPRAFNALIGMVNVLEAEIERRTPQTCWTQGPFYLSRFLRTNVLRNMLWKTQN